MSNRITPNESIEEEVPVSRSRNKNALESLEKKFSINKTKDVQGTESNL